MKSELLKLTSILLTSSLLSLGLPLSQSQAALVNSPAYGTKCRLEPGTLKFTGGTSSDAVRLFSDFDSINIYFAKTLMSGALVPLSPNSLEFTANETMISIARAVQPTHMSGDVLYPTTQTTTLFNKKGTQLKTEADLPENEAIFNVYSHTYTRSSGSADTKLTVVITEEQITDHSKVKSATLKYESTAPAALPPAARASYSGAVTANLLCEGQF